MAMFDHQNQAILQHEAVAFVSLKKRRYCVDTKKCHIDLKKKRLVLHLPKKPPVFGILKMRDISALRFFEGKGLGVSD